MAGKNYTKDFRILIFFSNCSLRNNDFIIFNAHRYKMCNLYIRFYTKPLKYEFTLLTSSENYKFQFLFKLKKCPCIKYQLIHQIKCLGNFQENGMKF